MTRLINMDNGGTLTDFCLIDGEEVRYTKTLTMPYGLSRCLLDSLAKVSELAYGEPQRFLFNAGRRLRDAPARQPSRIFRRRLTARSPRPGRPDPKP